jgi:hypothetical protein
MRGFRLRPGGENKQAKFHTMMPSFAVVCYTIFVAS